MNSKSYETRARRSSVWLPLTEQELRDSMERNHMRYSELMSHIEDLDAGHVLHADNGRQYRLAVCTPSADKCRVHGYASCPIENLPSAELDAVADALNGVTLPELDDDAIEAEELAQIAFEAEQRADQLDFVRTHYGDATVKLIESGWTIDSAISHAEGTCDRELCTGEHGRSHFVVDIDMESDALSSDRTELSRLLRLVADRIEVGVYDEKLRDVNGVSVGAHHFALIEG